MPQQTAVDNNPADTVDPTPAEAAQLLNSQSSGRKARKTTSGTTGSSTKTAAQPNSTTPPISSPIRPAGTKRRQTHSPQASPHKPAALSAVNTTGGDVGQSLTPLKLDAKLSLLGDLKHLTPYQAAQIVGDKDWKGEMWQHKDIMKVLQGSDSPLDWETLYVFTKQSELNLVNLNKIKMELCKRASMCKNPASSKFYHGNGPFYIKCDRESIGVFNKNEKEIAVFSYDSYGLPTGEFEFDLSDGFTHDTLCGLNLSCLVEKLTAMKNGVGPIAALADPSNAPFSFDKADDGKIGLSSSFGLIATIEMAELQAPANEPAVSSTKIRFGTTDTRNYNRDDTPAAASKNSFSALGDGAEDKVDNGDVKGAESDEQAGGTDKSNPGKKPPSKSKPKPAASKSVDEMSDQEFEEELSKASQESAGKEKRSTRRCNRRRAAKDAAMKKSWMEPKDSDSNEDSDYEASKEDGSDSAEEVYNESDDEPSDLSGDESDGDLKQAKPKLGEEGIRISAKSFGGVEDKSTDEQGSTSPPAVDAYVTFGNESNGAEWMDEGSTGSNSSLDKEAEMINLVDRVPLTPGNSVGGTATTDLSTITGVTDPSEIFPNQDGKYLFAFTIRLVPNRKHKEVLVEKTRTIFQYFKSVVDDFVMLPATQSALGTAIPVVEHLDDPHFPTKYGDFTKYGIVSNKWVLTKEEIDAPTLTNRLAAKQNKQNTPKGGGRGKRARLKTRGESSAPDDGGPTDLWVYLSFMTRHPDIDDLVQSFNIDVGTDEGIYCTVKTVQCWKSDAKYILVCVNNHLCPVGVKSTLRETFTDVRRKLCRRGKLNAIEWYDKPIPEFHVYSRKLKPMRGIPDSEREELGFEPYPGHTHFAYFIEASKDAWDELEVIIDYFVNSNHICKSFGPSAYFQRNPDGMRSQNIDFIREYQATARKHMGYQLLTTVVSCAHVNLWEHPVRVKMEEQEVIDSTGTPTGQRATPVAPYRRTTLRAELQDITINGKQVFHTAIVTERGHDAGYSQIVVSVDPSNPYTPAFRDFARNTAANLPGFIFHYFRTVKGFHESTCKRLENCLYIDSAGMAEHYSWDPITMKATPQISTRRERWHSESSHLDVKRKSKTPQSSSSTPAFLGNSPVELTDDVKKDLLRKLRVDTENIGPDAGREGASVLTGGTDGVSAGSSVNTANMARKSHDLALNLAEEKRKNFEQSAEMARMQAELARLTAMVQQGAPHLSGSDVPLPEVDRGGGMSQG